MRCSCPCGLTLGKQPDSSPVVTGSCRPCWVMTHLWCPLHMRMERAFPRLVTARRCYHWERAPAKSPQHALQLQVRNHLTEPAATPRPPLGPAASLRSMPTWPEVGASPSRPPFGDAIIPFEIREPSQQQQILRPPWQLRAGHHISLQRCWFCSQQLILLQVRRGSSVSSRGVGGAQD